MPHGKAQPVHYNLYIAPPRIFWRIPISAPRDEVPQLCEQLHTIISERNGAAFYFANVADGVTLCRYEWNRKWRGQKHALRLVFEILVGDIDVTEVMAYATTHEAIKDPTIAPPTLPKRLVTRLQQECLDTLTEAIRRFEPENNQPRHILFYIRVPQNRGIQNLIRTEDDRIRVFPTTVVSDKDKDKQVSAVVVTVNSTSIEGAKPKALQEVALLCALLTLASGELWPGEAYKTTRVRWSHKRPPIYHLDSVEDVNNQDLYSYNLTKLSPASFDPYFEERLLFIWGSYHKLSEKDQQLLLPALFAYHSGKDISDEQPTVASVAYVAALGALAGDRVQKCPGSITCSVCGTLPDFRHYTFGDAAAIVSFVLEMFELAQESKEAAELKRLIKRVYSQQRSAFVHGAVLRHGEYHQNFGLPSALPDVDNHVSELYFFRWDLFSIQEVARQTLLRWFTKRVGTSLDRIWLGLERLDSILEKSHVEVSVVMNIDVVVNRDRFNA